MNRKIFLNELLMIFGTMIWGVAFVFQDMGNDHVSPLTFNVERCFVAFVFLFIVYLILLPIQKKRKTLNEFPEKKYSKKDWLIGSIVCGFFLSLSMAAQQIGISFEGAGKSGFITALYIVFVPIINIFFKKKPNILIIIGILFSITGLVLINYTDGSFSWSNGSWFLLACALCFAFQILAVDRYSKKCNSILLTAGEFMFACIFQIPFMFIFETPEITGMLNAWLPVLFCGVASSGIAYTIQVYSQKVVPPTIASIIMSMESVFSIIAACIILSERYGTLEIIGCVCIFLAILVAQLPLPIKKKKIDQKESTR